MKAMLYKILGWFLRGLVRTIGRTIYRLKIRGTENIPQAGGALLVANHSSYMDFVLVLSCVPRHVRFVMNADVFKKPGLKWLLHGLNCIPISPRGGKNDFEAFNNSVTQQVNSGNVVVIFAEGTVTRTGQILEFKKGVEHLSGMISAPVIPIHFHNVQGTPFTFRIGKSTSEKFSWKNLRREILVNIGQPTLGKISAFELRQQIKELEVENFNFHLSRMRPINELLEDQITNLSAGSWDTMGEKFRFSNLRKHLSILDNFLKPLLLNDETVGLLLPKNQYSYLIELWMVLHKKIIININPDFSNEERYYVINRAKIATMITTDNLDFTKYSPNAERLIYIEHIIDALNSGKEPNVFSKKIGQVRRSVSSLFNPGTPLDEVVTIIFERQHAKDELKCVALTHRNILSALLGFRQIYYFEKGSRMMSNLPIYHSYGFVVEFLLPLLYDLHLELVQENINGHHFISSMERARPSLVIATPSQLASIAALSQVKNIPFLTHVFTADLHPDNHNIELLGQRGIRVMVCAGMNETSSVFAVNLRNYEGKDIAGKMMEQENMEDGTIGKPLPGVALKVCDASMNELGVEHIGILWIKGACVAPSLSDEISCRTPLHNGWFNTGLEGSLNHKGFAKLESRKKQN